MSVVSISNFYEGLKLHPQKFWIFVKFSKLFNNFFPNIALIVGSSEFFRPFKIKVGPIRVLRSIGRSFYSIDYKSRDLPSCSLMNVIMQVLRTLRHTKSSKLLSKSHFGRWVGKETMRTCQYLWFSVLHLELEINREFRRTFEEKKIVSLLKLESRWRKVFFRLSYYCCIFCLSTLVM